MIENDFDKKTGQLTVRLFELSKGLNTRSSPINLIEGTVPEIQNMDIAGGFPSRMNGSTLHDTAMVMPDSQDPTVFFRYNPSSGSGSYIAGGRDGHVYRWTGSAFTSLRRGLSTTAGLWWSHTQLGDYGIISNPTDGNYKYDGTRLLPLGAKYIADMETGEATWAGGSVTASTVRQGLQARSLAAAAGGTDSMNLQPATPLNLTSGLLSARAYNATTDRISFQVNLDVAANLDTALSYIRFGDVADTAYFQAAASTWGTLTNGWNLVRIARSDFTPTGVPNWNNIAKVTFFIDANPATNVTAVFDDVYTIYDADSVMPGGQINANWKNIVYVARANATPSQISYAKVSAPDEYAADAVLPVDENDGTELTGLHSYYDQMLVTKENSILSLSVRLENTVYPNYTFGLRRITVEHGCSSHRSLVEAAGRVFMWWQQGLYIFEGIGTRKGSYVVEPTLADRNEASLRFIVGANSRELNQVWYFWPPEGASQNSNGIRFDYQETSFLSTVGQTMALAERIFDSGREYLVTAGYTGRIVRQDNGTSFDGTAITAFVTLPWISGGRPDELKSWLELIVQYETQASGSLVVEYRLANHPREFNAAAYVTADTIDMSVRDDLGLVFIGDQSRWIQVRLRTVGAPVTIFWPLVINAAAVGAIY